MHAFNQRDIAGILAMIRTLGALIGASEKAEALGAELRTAACQTSPPQTRGHRRPRVFFEEWDDPLIGGICWVSELVEIAGGEDVFPHHRSMKRGEGPHRLARRPSIEAAPELILASVVREEGRAREDQAAPGWMRIPRGAQRSDWCEIKSPLILQPGPAALTDGLDAIRAALAGVR